MAINTVALTGNLTAQPELRATGSGFKILECSIAVNEWSKTENKEIPSFFDFKVLGKRAEALSGILSKGDKVCVSGKLKQDRWEASDGGKRSKVYVVADEVVIMSRRDGAANPPAPSVPQQPPQMRMPQPSYYDEDIPF